MFRDSEKSEVSHYNITKSTEGGESMSTLLRASKAAKKIDVTVDRLYEYSRIGIIPVVKIGRQLRWSEEAIEEFIKNGGKAFPGGWRREA